MGRHAAAAGGEEPHQVARDGLRLERIEPDAPDPLQVDRLLEKPDEAQRRVEVLAVVACVHAGQHDLAEAGPGQALQALEDEPRRQASARAANGRDDTVRAAQVAPVLHLEEGARPVARTEARLAPLRRAPGAEAE